MAEVLDDDEESDAVLTDLSKAFAALTTICSKREQRTKIELSFI